MLRLVLDYPNIKLYIYIFLILTYFYCSFCLVNQIIYQMEEVKYMESNIVLKIISRELYLLLVGVFAATHACREDGNKSGKHSYA